MKVKGKLLFFVDRLKQRLNVINLLKKTKSTDTVLSVISFSSSEDDDLSLPGTAIRKYSDNIDGSALAMFARMSTTIAATMSEKEFGEQKNDLYRPNTNSYPSKVVHPVLCKRDIFVQTPQKNKHKIVKGFTIYRVGDENIIGNGSSEEKRKTKTTQGRSTERKPINDKTKSSSSGEGVHGHDPRTRSGEINSYSISASMLFNDPTKSSVKTGRIASADNEKIPATHKRIHSLQEEVHNRAIARPSKKVKSSISPSSTISSLTTPAEIGLNTIPRSIHQGKMKNASPKLLEDIQEQSVCSDDFSRGSRREI